MQITNFKFIVLIKKENYSHKNLNQNTILNIPLECHFAIIGYF